MITQTAFALLLFLTVSQGKIVNSEEKIQDKRDKIKSEIYRLTNTLKNLQSQLDHLNKGFSTTDKLAVSSTSGAVQKITETALYKYVHKPDPHYTWQDTGQRISGKSKFCTKNCGFVGYVLNMTSQGWLTAEETSCSVWTHQLVVIVPDNLENETTGFLYVTGGNNNDVAPPDPLGDDVMLPAAMAVATSSLGAVLFQVPNQPCVFTDDPLHEERSEDSFCAFTWAHYMKSHPKAVEYVSLLPMVKSVVRAMDTIMDFRNGKTSQFVVAGASKRGWTTWLTAPVDSRVVAIAPIVMDLLNFEAGLLHMFRSYGNWTFAFEPYWKENITQAIVGNPDGLKALGVVLDPLNYKEWLRVPKLVVDATGDEFFMPDDDWFWWKDMSDGSAGEIYRLMVDNAEHSFATGVYELVTGVAPFYQSILRGTPRPKFYWTLNHDEGTIDLVSETNPVRVVLRQATSTDNRRRDFRLIKGDTKADPCTFIPVKIFGESCVNPVLWCGSAISPEKTQVFEGGPYHYRASVPIPPDGRWRAFLLEIYYPGPEGPTTLTKTFKFTTQVQIVPFSFPFKNCATKDQCHGSLV
eukprot:g16170.t1